MGSRLLVVMVANGIVMLATNATFNAWVDDRFGYLDLEMIGISGIAWPMGRRRDQLRLARIPRRRAVMRWWR